MNIAHCLHIHENGQACGYAAVKGFIRRGQETLVGVILKPDNREIPLRTVVCRSCLAKYLAMELVQDWRPLSEFIEYEKSLVGLIQLKYRRMCESAAREMSRKMTRADRRTRQNAWREQGPVSCHTN